MAASSTGPLASASFVLVLLLAVNVAETRRMAAPRAGTQPEAAILSPAAEPANESSLVEASGRAAVVEGELAEVGHLLGGRFVLEQFVESREQMSRADRHEEMSRLARVNGTEGS